MPFFRRNFRPALRVVALLGALSLLCSLWLASRAKAAGERALFAFADHMMRIAGAEHQTTPVELRLNGASFYLSHASVDAPTERVLDLFQAKCAEKNGQIGAQWAQDAQAVGRTLSGLSGLDETSGVFDGVLRAEQGDAGFVVCFEVPEGGRLLPNELVSRVQRFAETGDAAHVGHLRYARVTRSQSDPGRSVFVAVWTEGALPLFTMFPEQGDAPGRDPEGITRPARTRRILSSEQIDRDVLVTMYQSERGSAAELRSFYEQMLRERGFSLLDAPGVSGKSRMSSDFIVATNERQMVTVALASDADGRGIATLSTRPD